MLRQIQDIGMCDAHCHPTTCNVEQLANLGSMKTTHLVCMSTSLKDMNDVANLANDHPGQVVPAFGLHPWFSHHFYHGDPIDKATHYKKVLNPAPLDDFIAQLPDPLHIDILIEEMRKHLKSNVHALVGECGLDKIFRIPDATTKKLSRYTVNMDHQIDTLKVQLDLAAEYGRAVSLHGVRCPKTLLDVVKLYGRRLSKICLHSFSGNPKFLEQNWYMPRSQLDRPDLPIVYVSLSHLVNNTTRTTTLAEIIHAIPPDRLLLESDYSSAGDAMDQLNVRILRAAAEASKETVVDLAELTKRNLFSFLKQTILV